MTRRSDAKRSGLAGEFVAFGAGTLLGAVAGAAVALWFAPGSGQQTRRELRAQAEQARERLDGPPVERLMAEAKTAAQSYRKPVDEP
jgi:gas vesicle protein